ncbi:MAG: hypothetical protein LBR52_01530 [Prevotellaceae bacterium]|jgi:predicted glycosyltransferase|nr:hypothetical protein [Prevotellaceae bacterium]
MAKKRVLFAPLNWGLGHAVRSVPVLKELAASGFEIILAGNGFSLDFLRREFPCWQYLVLPSFEMRYSKGNSQVNSVLKAIPGIISASWKEHRQLRHLIKSHNIDVVISDNRFGLFNQNCISVYITHQLTIPLPAGFRFLTPVVRKLHRMIISNYTYCWIPDEPGTINLSGNLSHNQVLPENARFIGILSRFRKETFSVETEKRYDFLFILSGVEPQRTMLEKRIISLFQENSSHKAVLVRGIPCEKESVERAGELTIINRASEKELKSLLETSEVVVCRSGYTSVMELASISKRAVLIPTPGQPEQEYLAEYLSAYPLFSCIKQDELTFSQLLSAAESVQDQSLSFSSGLLRSVKEELLH